jgi:hypothetical protein
MNFFPYSLFVASSTPTLSAEIIEHKVLNLNCLAACTHATQLLRKARVNALVVPELNDSGELPPRAGLELGSTPIRSYSHQTYAKAPQIGM